MSTLTPLHYHRASTSDLEYACRRICAFGSFHPGGADFALADGSLRFISETIDLANYRAISTRGSNEAVQVP